MKTTFRILTIAGLLVVMGLPTAQAARIGGGGSIGVSRSITAPARPAPSYRPSRPSYAGAAAKPSAPPAGKDTQPMPAAPASRASSGSGSSSSGSFWTPFLLGYLIADSSSSKAAPATTRHSSTPAVSEATKTQAEPPPAQSPAAKAGPFAIDIPGAELLDSKCDVKPAAKDFITSAKIPNSVLFITLPPDGRCEQARARLRDELRPAILVRSDIGMVQLIRVMGSTPNVQRAGE